MSEQYANDPGGVTLGSGINNSVTSLGISSATGYPGSGTFRIRIDNEIIIVGAISGTTLSSLTRGAEGTTAASHSSGAAVSLVLTAGSLAAIPGTVLGYLYVDTQESTASATPVDLATLDTVTFTLDKTTDVIIQYNCEVFSSGTTAAVNQANVDGSIVSASNLQFANLSSSNVALPYFIVVPALAAGTHTIKMQHWTTGGSVQWSARTLLVLRGFS